MAASALALSNIQMVTQVSGTPGSAQTNDDAYFLPTSGCQFSVPSSVNDTRDWGAFAADLGFTWDTGDGSCLCVFGDTFDFDWVGPFTAVSSDTSVTRVYSSGAPADLVNLSNHTLTFTATTAAFGTSGIAAWLCASGAIVYFSHTGRSGSTLTGCTYITHTGSGATTSTAADSVCSRAAALATATGLTNRTHVGWRSQTAALTTDADLTDGPTFTDMRPLSANDTATHILDSANNSTAITDVMFGAINETQVVYSGGYGTATTTGAHGLLPGQWIRCTSAGSITTVRNFMILEVPSSTTFKFWGSVLYADGTDTTMALSYASNLNAARPTLNDETSKLPTGGVSYPLGGGAFRQYLFYKSTFVPEGEVGGHEFTNFMGIAYSDDEGATWTDVSKDSTVASGSNGANVTTLTSLFVANALWTVLPTAGSVEVTTSNGIALISWTGKTGTTELTGASCSFGTGTLATGNGVRYAMWGNDANFTAYHQQAWPWRPGDGYIYCMTTMGGRYGTGSNGPDGGGGARMMRVAEADVLSIAAWRYWDGSTWNVDKTAAYNIFPDGKPVGEPSFYYHPGSGLYVSTYYEHGFNFNLGAIMGGSASIVIRTAGSPEGPWSDRAAVIPSTYFVPAGNDGQLYGGFVHPWSNVGAAAVPTGPSGTVTTSVSGGNQTASDFFFHLSLADPYATYLVKATLTNPTAGAFFSFL
jgi:hypothetical protein